MADCKNIEKSSQYINQKEEEQKAREIARLRREGHRCVVEYIGDSHPMAMKYCGKTPCSSQRLDWCEFCLTFYHEIEESEDHVHCFSKKC